MILDTEVSNVWITDYNDNDNDNKVCTKRSFQADRSDTYHDLNVTFNSNDGKLDLTGNWSNDFIGFQNELIARSNFGVISQIDNSVCNISYDGVLGLGLDTLTSSPDNKTWFTHLNNIYNDSYPFFSFNISLNQDITSLSKFTIGEYLPDYSDVIYNKHDVLTNTGHWTLPMNSILVNGKSVRIINNYCDPYCPAMIDSGQLVTTVPSEIYLSFLDHISGSYSSCGYNETLNRYMCRNGNDCHNLPVIGFQIPDYTKNMINYNLTSQDYTYMLSSGGCVILIENSQDPLPTWKLGLTFLNRYYTVFNKKEMKILLYDKYQENGNNDTNYKNFNKFVLTLMVIALIIIIGLFFYAFYKCCKYRDIPHNNNYVTHSKDTELLYNEL